MFNRCYFYISRGVIKHMRQNITTKQYCIVTILFMGFLFSAGLFTPEEYVYDQPEAYIEGATQPTVEVWEMY